MITAKHGRNGAAGLVVCGVLSVAVLLGTIGGAEEIKKEREYPKLDLHPLTAPGFYEKDGKKFERSLYPGGKNEMPDDHRRAGEELAKSLVPLNEKGEPDPKNGQIVALAVGHSNCRDCFREFEKILPEKQKEGIVNPRFRLISIAKGGKQCLEWVSSLKAKDKIVAGSQAQIVFLMTTYHGAGRAKSGPYAEVQKMPFEKKMLQMKTDVTTVIQELTAQCPNLKMIYIGADSWRGYAGLEPEVYEEGFAYKWLIEDQIKGAPELAFKGAGRKAAWLAWGGYLWEPNPPGDRYRDGVHASATGLPFVVNRWMERLEADPTTRPWFFLKPGEKKKPVEGGK